MHIFSPPSASMEGRATDVLLSKRARRKAAQREEARRVGTSHETTAQRSRAAAELHSIIAARAPSRHAIPGRLAARLVQWYMQSCVLSTSATARAARASALVHLEPPLDRLCAYARLKPSGRCLQWRMLLALYAPIGLALVAARMLFLLAAVISLACLSVLGAALPFLWTTERIDDAATHVLRALCWGLGFVVRVRSVGSVGGHPRHSSQGAPPTVDDALATLQAATVIVANHVSQWDGLPIRLLTPCATLVRETYTRRGVSGSLAARIATGCLVAPIVSTAFTPIPVPTPSAPTADRSLPSSSSSPSLATGTDATATAAEASGRAIVREAMQAHVTMRLRRGTSNGIPSVQTTRPLLVFPEGSITNGRAGVMRFAASAFSLGAPVLPIAIDLRTPLPLEQDTIWSPLGENLFFTLFQPWHIFGLSILPERPPPSHAASCDGGLAVSGTAERSASERAAAEVAADIAAELGIVSTGWTTKAKTARAQEAKRMGKSAWLAALAASTASDMQ